MAYYSDSSSESEDVGGVVQEVVAEEDITGASWYAGRSSEDELPPEGQPKDPVKMTARAYQLEMLEASLKENLICAMDTGSGKTQVAILRIRAELERMPDDQVIWFLAPTVSLCAQQFEVVRTQIPSVQTRIITGAEKVDSWSASTWDGALVNVKVVISTHQVLLDALLHGFVQISSLALLIFDEAHHCNKNHPYSRIMKEFYWEWKAKGQPVPHVLGLTASPVIRSDVSSLEKLEATLNAICRSPTKHREELLAHSQRPSLINVTFKTQPAKSEYTESMAKLFAALNKLNIMEDPYVVCLQAEKTDRSRRELAEAIGKKKTYVQNSMRSFCRRSFDIATDLGSWAADWFISETIRRFLAGVIRQGAASETFGDAEVVYLARVFQVADISPPPICEQSGLSDKVHQLIDVLLKYDGDARGIIFVKERATTVVLAHILAIHPEVSKKFRTGTMVGTSFVPGFKRDFLDLAETRGLLPLEAFRAGKKNLLLATSVLEEGIDVPACNLVICVDKPRNLKSFIQRRGRARMRQSHLYIFMDEQEETFSTNWEDLEAEMKQHYEDEMRELHKLEALEESESLDYPELRIDSTGARLTIHDAKSHLQHFCATLTSRRYVDHHPDYLVEELHHSARPGASVQVKATVLLPVSVPQNLRQATSSRSWESHRNACMDAAFQAYQALHKAGLIDDHLLPLRDRLERDIESRSAMKEIQALYNPWLTIAHAWDRDDIQFPRRALKVLDQSGSLVCDMELVFPGAIPKMKPMTVWWDHNTQLTLRLDPDVVMAGGDNDILRGSGGLADHTPVLLSLAYCHRNMEIKDDCVLRFISPSNPLSMDQLGNVPFTPDLAAESICEVLVRDERVYARRQPYYFDSFLPSKPPSELIRKTYNSFEEDPEDVAYVAVKKWPRKSGFFHRPVAPRQPPSSKPYALVLPAKTTTVDSIPLVYAQFGLLIPSLIHYIEIHLLATKLSQTLLAPLKLSDVSMIVEAICASSARTPRNYERVEFLGDSILKTCITVNVAATNLRLPEGLLSLLKDRLVSNARLSRACSESGLDQFIVTQQLVLKGWRPPYVSDLLKKQQSQQEEARRVLSTKTLADVVEAIIGVSYLDDGLPKALQCIRLLIPESQPDSLRDVRDKLVSAAEPKNMSLPADLRPLEELIEYSFCEKALLVEAVTHPSYNMSGTVACFERLEFIGDAILDFIVVQEVYAIDDPPLENWQMHLLRTALVNADILGFLVMEWSYKQLRFDVRLDGTGGGGDGGRASPELTQTEVALPLWSFMRQSSAELTAEREATRARHAELRESILDAMHNGTHYPWALFARLRAQKFFSDLFEALVGAIWVDSGPEFDACAAFVEKSGVLPYLRRLLRDNVHVLHPKEELGRLAERDAVEYVAAKVDRVDGEREWACEVRIGERSVVAVTGCLFKEEAKVRAATQACEILKAERV